jgi:uncharacterized RDD family membrane protein YckC
MTTWYYALNGQTYGPVSDQALRDLAHSGVLNHESSVIVEGSASWTPLYVHEATLGLRRGPDGRYSAGPPPLGAPISGVPHLPPPPAAPPGYTAWTPNLGATSVSFASWWGRVGAFLLDLLVLLVPSIVINALFGFGANGWSGFGFSPNARSVIDEVGAGRYLAATLLNTAVGVGYYVYFHGKSGQTVGKKIVGIRVVGAQDGQAIGYSRAAGRYLVQIPISLLICIGPFLNYLWPLWDQRKQTWHDKAARSVVVKVN